MIWILYLRDNSQVWLLQSDGSYQKKQQAGNEESIQAQNLLLHELQVP